MKWYLIKIDVNGNPYERSQAFNEEPLLEDGWNTIWTQDDWNNHLASIPITPNVISKEDIHKLAEYYQDLYYDSRGVTFLLNVKQDLIKAYSGTVDTVLVYQMIESVSRWINKLWNKAFYYDMVAAGGVEPNIDFDNEVGLPPCKFRDIVWILDPSFQVLEPNRVVNQDINYYISWV